MSNPGKVGRKSERIWRTSTCSTGVKMQDAKEKRVKGNWLDDEKRGEDGETFVLD